MNMSAGIRNLTGGLAALTIVVGFIIWLAQLNWYALQSTETNARQDAVQHEILAKQVEVTQNVQKSALLLSILMDEVKDLKVKVNGHQQEAEMWKEKIRNNSKDIETYGD